MPPPMEVLEVVQYVAKLRSTGPLIPEVPEHFCLVLLIERNSRINEKKPPVPILVILGP